MKDAIELMEQFSHQWPSGRKDFRTADDSSWKMYATTLRDLVMSGDSGEVSRGLGHANRQVRALASRAHGFISSPDSVASLARVLHGDEWATVRLLAADALGMIGTVDAREELQKASATEENTDVALHIKIALARVSGLERRAAEDLAKINEALLGTALVNSVAPDFSLPTPGGDEIRFSEYRDGRPVALYFLYGDG